MASGNSWQLYQELGDTPASILEALKRFARTDSRHRRRRMTTQLPISPRLSTLAVLGEDDTVRTTLVTSPSASCLGYTNSAYHSGSRGEDGCPSRSQLRRSHSQPRLTAYPMSAPAPEGAKVNWTLRRNSLSFRAAKEKGRKLLTGAKTFLDVTILPNTIRATTPPPSPQTRSTSSSSVHKQSNDEDSDTDNELFTTASDLSGLKMAGWDEEDEDEDDVYEDFSQIVRADANREPSETSLGGDTFVQLCRRRRYSTRSGHDPACPVHGTLQKRVSVGGRSITSRVCNRQPSLISRRSSRRRQCGSEIDADISASALVAPKVPTVGSSNFMLKLARRRHKAALNRTDRQRVERERSKILRNLLTLSVAFLFLISAFQGLQNLQTTIHSENGLGAISLSVVYLGLVVSCLFTPPYLLNRIGCKLTLLLSICTFSVYMLTHFMPKWYSLIPGSLLVGFGAAPLWAAKCSYLSEAGFRYAELNLESSNAVIVRFFGIFFMIVHTGQVFGNLISSWILRTAIGGGAAEIVDSVDETCGHYFTDVSRLSPTAAANLARPSATAVYSLCAVYFCCTIVAALIIAMFLNQLRRDMRIQREKPRFKLDIWKTTVRHLKKPRHLLLVPLTIFNGMQQAFIAGEFTKVYVGCCLGISAIGYVMMSFGTFDAVCSLVFGPLIKLFGRMPLLMFGAVVDMLMIFTLLVWPPNPADTVIFYVIAACWGMADGVWSTQINGLWVVIFADNLAAAFANYRLWESVGFIIAFAYTPFLSTETKLYILLAMLWIGMLGFGLIEMWEPLEDYALDLQQKLQAKMSPRRNRRSGSVKKKRERAEDVEATEKLLGTTESAPGAGDNTIAPLALEETDF